MSIESHGNPFGNAPLAPMWVGVAITFLPPLGIFLLWKHPTLRSRGVWWKAAYAWTALWTIAQVGNVVSPKKAAAPAVAPGGSDAVTTKAEFERDYREMCREAGEPFNRKLFEEAWQVMRQTGQGY